MEMLDDFIEQQRQIYPFPDEAAQLFLSELEEVFFRKGDWLVREGDHDSYVWFVLNGLVRAFVERETRDVTLWFASAGELLNSSYRKTAAYNIEMIEDTVLLRIHTDRMEALCEQSLGLCNYLRKLQDNYLREYENYFINDSWNDARAQYETLMKDHPDLFQRVSLKHIASYLQITPQSLSRIRSSFK